ncbi:ABC transporter permease [Candidatus Bipolaricaulota bacterium]|nr:ABC transporter permease [Candidatus Bipolaricaulota bacterium]TFH10156.1 MAG: ABC transporter permease [Candidatus Atribacteria bacterium]
MIAIPLSEAKRLWQTSTQAWEDTPKRADPIWTNWFRSAEDKLPETIIASTEDVEPLSVEPLGSAGIAKQTITETTFDFPYYIHPSELALTFYATYQASAPLGRITWITPDGREFIIHDSVMDKRRHVLSSDGALARQIGAQATILGLFSNPGDVMRDLRFETATPQRGTYTLRVLSKTFEADSTLDVKLVVYGEVSGIAGTDHLRRGLIVGLLWGTPIALMFGLLAAVGTTVLTFIIAAIGVWFGGWVDALIQRITEVNVLLPLLPILVMLGIFYTPNIITILGVVVVLSIFSVAIKTYRALFLQVKNSPYIEAARAYGAGGFRIIFRYMIPKVAPILIPAFVTGTPGYVFLEAALAFLGVGDVSLPTWGKILNNANTQGALFRGDYYWVLEPAFMLLVTGLAFAMLGFALDRIFNPRLRET